MLCLCLPVLFPQLMKFKTYSYLLQAGPSSSSKGGTGLWTEGNSNGSAPTNTTVVDGSSGQPVFRAHKVERRISDRYSYRMAIHQDIDP